VNASNFGNVAETFYVTLNYTEKAIDPTIETQIVTLDSGESKTLTFSWIFTDVGGYELLAYTSTIEGDIDLSNNVATREFTVIP
jgi:hypothetical protein